MLVKLAEDDTSSEWVGHHSVIAYSTILTLHSHLSNEGVEETPPAARLAEPTNGGPIPLSASTTFVDLSSANVGFKHWNPISVTGSANKLAGQAEMGGVWEWTSSPLEKQKGFEPMELYPAYSGESCGKPGGAQLMRWQRTSTMVSTMSS